MYSCNNFPMGVNKYIIIVNISIKNKESHDVYGYYLLLLLSIQK